MKTVAQKLFMKPGYRVAAVNAPGDYGALVGPLPDGVTLVAKPDPKADFVHLFVKDQRKVVEAAMRFKKV